MTITVRSRIERGHIRLPKSIRLPEGTEVVVEIQPILKKKEKRDIAAELCGTWSDDPTIGAIFEDIEQQRHQYAGRQLDLE